MKKSATILLATVLLAACGTSRKAITPNGPGLYQKWELKVLNGNDIPQIFMKPLYIEFDQNGSKVNGSSGCNQFFGNFSKSGNAIEFGPLGSTKMFCDPPSNKIENEFLASIPKVNKFRIEGTTLVLLANSEVIARFEESNAVPEDMAGRWELFYITGRRIAFQGLYPEQKPYINFQEGSGSFSAHTSCNSLMGSYKAKDGKLFNLGAMTLMACQGEGEQVFLDELGAAEAYEVSGDTLTFLKSNIPSMKFIKMNNQP